MLSFPHTVRIFLHAGAVDLRKSFDGLSGLVSQAFPEQDFLSGHLFLFFNGRRDRIKMLHWDADGLVIWYKQDGPATFLADFAGYLQADAYSGYDGLYLGPQSVIHEVACWAHARRKFYDAQSSWPGYAGLILEAIGRLYDVEDRARELSVEERQPLRARESMPILERLRGELDRLAEKVLPKSSLGEALGYARNQWAALCCYTTGGRLTIDNNAAERRLRDQAIGRKNWLFLGSVEAGPRVAMLSTIMAGARRHRLEPWAYVRDVVMALSVDPERVEDLLPDRWRESHPEHVMTHRLEESREKARRRDARRAERRKGK